MSEQLDLLSSDQLVMLKLTLPTVDGLYDEFVEHPRVLRVAALSGGYDRDEANMPARPEPRHDRQLLAGVDRGAPTWTSPTTSSMPSLAASVAAIYDASIT